MQECDDLHTKVLEYEVTVDNLHKKLSKADKDNQEMEKLQIKKEKLITENKLLRNEVENSRSDASGNKTKLKLCEKDLQNAKYRLEKKQSELVLGFYNGYHSFNIKVIHLMMMKIGKL